MKNISSRRVCIPLLLFVLKACDKVPGLEPAAHIKAPLRLRGGWGGGAAAEAETEGDPVTPNRDKHEGGHAFHMCHRQRVAHRGMFVSRSPPRKTHTYSLRALQIY